MNHIFHEPKAIGNLERYEAMIEDISRESGKMAWSSGYSVTFYMVSLITLVTIAACVFSRLTNIAVIVFFFLGEFIALFVTFALSQQKAGEYTQERCIELNREHPGIYEAYEEWQLRRNEESQNTQ